MHLVEVTTASHNVHVYHRATAAVGRGTRIRHATETALAMHSNAKAGRHWPHLAVEVHHVQWVTHLLLDHHVASLVAHHVVDRHLAFSSTLL